MTRALTIVAAFLIAGSTSAPSAAQDLVLRNANLIDVTTGAITRGATIRVAAGKIASIDAAGAAATPGAIDLHGRFVMPGLMDAHVHITSIDQARRALHSGVTTARSMGVSNYVDVGLRELARAGHTDAPELLAAGYHVRPSPAPEFFFQHPELGRYMAEGIRGPDAVRAMVRAQLTHDLNFIKTNATERAGLPETDPRKQLYDEAELRVIIEEAAAKGLGVAAHAHGDEGARAAAVAGVRSIEHGTYLSTETLRIMAQRGTYLVPTVAIVTDLATPAGDYDDAGLQVRGRHMLPRLREMVRGARAAGVKIVAATDTGYGPTSTTRVGHELEEFVAAGMTPLEALQSATTRAAELFGIAERTGRIAPGFEADLIVLERNPLENIMAAQDVLMVINNGRVAVRRGDWPDRTE